MSYPQIAGTVINGELGRGAHSVVYSGRRGGVACAVKLPRERARWSRWIYREAVALARVKHSLLPAVIEVGEIDGLPFLVMELVDGETLAEKLDRGPLDEETTILLARQLAAVLGAVHEARLVHRDVKPQNIIVDRSTGTMKLVDFGFATPMERVGAGDTAGTAGYAAPEQLVPGGSVDDRTDLYAVGRVLFEARSGRSLAARIGLGPWGSEAKAELVARGTSAALAELIGALLERCPDNRYPSAASVTAELERVVQGLPLLGPRGYPARPAMSKHLVGRELELERALAPLRDLRGGGAVVVVRGASGDGKSHLLATIGANARAFGRTLFVTCRQNDPPLSALRRALDAYAGDQGESKALEELRPALENLAPVVRLIASPSIRLRLNLSVEGPVPTPVAEAGAPPDWLAEGVAQLLLLLANRTGGLSILIDDAQWMDPASADALARVAHRVAEAPLALVLATRAARAATDRFSGLRAGRSVEIELPRLTQQHVADLIASHLGEVTVDPALVARIQAMAGGTPLGVFEVLGAFLDAGAVRPEGGAWTFDAARSVVLPRGALALLGRRLTELPAAVLRVLEAAAVFGTSFDDALLARAVEVAPDDLMFALTSARRAGLVEVEAAGRHRFIHDSLREMLVNELAEADRHRLNQQAAEVLDAERAPSFEELCAIALHYAAGEREKTPARAYKVARAAGEAAVARFDNATALMYLGDARSFADTAGIRLDSAFHVSCGEALLRLASLEESLAAFESALEHAGDAIERATILGRLSWVYQVRAEPDQAWSTLDRAFQALGHQLPVEDIASAASTSVHLARVRVGKLLGRPSQRRQSEVDLLCQLHHQNGRLGLEYGKPARVIQSSFEALELSESAGSSRSQARAHALYAVVMTSLGRKDAGARHVSQAKQIASREDAPTLAFATQVEAIAASWGGDLDRSLLLIRECADIHGPWLELNEFFQIIGTGDIIESMRGRPEAAWAWMARTVERLRRTPKRPVVAEFLFHRARATLAAAGRQITDDPWLSEQLAMCPVEQAGQGFHRLMSWGPRARYYVEAGELGAGFEELVATFQAERHNPRTVHLGVAEFYIAVAHARIHQTLRERPSARGARLGALRSAVSDLGASAKIPLYKAHHLAAEGYLAWFEGAQAKATKRFAAAEALANQHTCPWVLYAVARGRAHMLRESGKEQAALDQARVARLFATEHGAVTRARWINEELGLGDARPEASGTTRIAKRGSSSTGSSRAHRQLAALLHVVRSPRRELRMEQQAAEILDELIGSLGAERAALWFQPEPTTVGTMVSRYRGPEIAGGSGVEAASRLLLRGVHESGFSWPVLADGLPSRSGDHPFDPKRVVAVPLSLYDKPVGALLVERGNGDVPFDLEDRSLLLLLSHQVPIALEIARLLSEREQVHASLQQAKKMEAMGALAGGLAHDFNNMLAAMRVALSAVQERPGLDGEITAELDVISQATTRASQLTRQLLSFSRHQPVPASAHRANELVMTLEPMLRRIVGTAVVLAVKLEATSDIVEVDHGSFDQALVNLAINARDAMPRGGQLTISTRNVVLEERAARAANVPPGEYLQVAVADTGEGMSMETQQRIFEPFFTTKPVGRGSGLGLAMVYAFARNSGGAIDVSSEPGKGTAFVLHLRRSERPHTSPPKRNAVPLVEASDLLPTRPDTILVVDDDDLVRRSIAKILERNGYRVIAASGSTEALDFAREHRARIALVILDVLMPGLTGPELGRRLDDLKLPAKLLFVSGFSPESIPLVEAQVTAEMMLQKPFSQAALLERVRRLMHS